MQETHELAHTGVGRLICGCWGKRNFNVWRLCEGCGDHPLAILATYGGPFYSFAFFWIGYWLMTKTSVRLKSIGFSLIISTMPISRVITPIFGGGDEVYALNIHFNNHTISWILGLAIVLMAVLPPTIKAWRIIENRRKNLWFASLLLVPFVMTGVVVFGILQGLLLDNGVLGDYWILGSPKLITFWFFFSVIIFSLTGSSLKTLLQPIDSGQSS
jgi:hypothetical protein